MKLFKILVCFFLINIKLNGSYLNTVSNKEVLIYDQFGHNFDFIANELKKFDIDVKRITKLDKKSEKLHIIFDAQLVPSLYFPKYYIIYQNLDLNEIPLTNNYLEKLKNAIAVWDYQWNNITKYSTLLNNYYYFPKNSTFIDPIILPCLISTNQLNKYKEILSYSNNNDSDISSHLPTIFCQSLLKEPKLIIELGIRGGESSLIFNKISEIFNAKLIGVDISEASRSVYKNFKNSTFLAMDDLNFPKWFEKSEFNTKKADIIFLDTSHYYEHTNKELNIFVDLLADNGILIFHDTNMCPNVKSTYVRLNNTMGIGWDNKKGVIRAVKEFFNIDFNEGSYNLINFSFKNCNWKLLHYPYCNGLTIIKKIV